MIMTTRNITLSLLAFTAVLATGAGVAYASGANENDALADLAKARVTLVQAVGTAEKHVGGRATQAELETEKGQTAYEVEVVAANRTVHDVKIDAVSGKVLSSTIDKADAEGAEGKGEADDD
jgi:uncharacterized membrane protein YkoI